MPECEQNKFEGVYKFRAAYPMQKRYQILKDFAATGSFSVSARENRVSYNTARSICDKFVTTGDCQPGARGRPACKMQPFMAAYLEAMVLVNPFLYLEEMQDRLMIDLNLLQNEVPSVPVICRTFIKTQVFQRTSSVSKIFDWSSEKCRFHIRSDITRPSCVLSGKCIFNSKTIDR